MSPEGKFKLKKSAALAAIITAALPISAFGAAGRIDFAIGDVQAIGADGQERVLRKGSAVNTGDLITTAGGARAHIRFTDGAYVSLKPNTHFRVEDYAFEKQAQPAQRRGFFSLLRGGLRTITGLIGSINRNSYRMNTPVATIGIRGTHYAVTLRDEPGAAGQPGEGTPQDDIPDMTELTVFDGIIEVQTSEGVWEIVQGATAIFNTEGELVEIRITTEEGTESYTIDEFVELEGLNSFDDLRIIGPDGANVDFDTEEEEIDGGDSCSNC